MRREPSAGVLWCLSGPDRWPSSEMTLSCRKWRVVVKRVMMEMVVSDD